LAAVGVVALLEATRKIRRGIDQWFGLVPIDGTREYRDRAGDGYPTMLLHLQSKVVVLYSLVFIPEFGPHGWWVEASGDRIVSGPGDL
jgi:3'-phosphoadenosine 5'-phosphosulfate (PAPS) 3'-phosphatase